jgi:alpha-beta hydrolase superfamily lysophospholipase
MRSEMILALTMSAVALTAKSESWPGLYRKADGGIVAIGEMHEFGRTDLFVDYTTGETGALFPLNDGRMGIGRAIGEKSPPAVRVLARKNGQLTLDDRPLTGLEIGRRTFQVQNEGVKLAGELARPKGKPKGVVVFVHGSGDGPRRAYDLWANFFLSRGWAVAVFDKRGSGESTGDWHDANFIALADDVRKVVHWTRGQEELAGLRIALWGASQAGWIIPQLTAENAVDFAIIQAGPATPVDDFLRLTLESELHAYEFPPDEIAKAVRYYDLDVAVSRGVKPFPEIERAYAEATAAGAEWLLKPPDPINAPDRRFMAGIAGFDAADYWRKTRTPLLILFGGKDHIVPVEPNRRRLEQLLAEAGNKEAQIVVLENDNHLNMLAKTGVRTEYATLNRFDPEYFRTLTAFLEKMSAMPPAKR